MADEIPQITFAKNTGPEDYRHAIYTVHSSTQVGDNKVYLTLWDPTTDEIGDIGTRLVLEVSADETIKVVNIVPFENNVYNLGSDELQFKDLYLSGSLIISGSIINTEFTQHKHTGTDGTLRVRAVDLDDETGNLGDILYVTATGLRFLPPDAVSGVSGYSGYSGWSGYSGFSGPSGYSGYSGYSGWSGVSGPSGADGASGYSGWSGISGYSGWSGVSGWSGKSGYSGWSGPSGFSGYSGWSGWMGESGYSGWSGISGPRGYIGPSGYSGYSGWSGWSGESGFSGWSGESGYSGWSGISGYSGSLS